MLMSNHEQDLWGETECSSAMPRLQAVIVCYSRVEPHPDIDSFVLRSLSFVETSTACGIAISRVGDELIVRIDVE